MFGRYFAMALFGVALISVPAFAQTTTGKPDASSNISHVVAGQWRSSKLIGVDVYNNKKEKIGDISDMLVDQNGEIQTVILSVGGFLGMDQHLVAVKFKDLQWWADEPIGGSANASPASPVPNSTSSPATTGSAVSTINTAAKMYPDHAVLNATKEQLKSMPEFKYPT
jgi:sporulation protein YlmC with PRC-barrel domain